MTCKDCESRKNGGVVYQVSCEQCRTDLAISEDCKLIRKYIADSLAVFGSCDWQREPNCGCQINCKRRQNAEQAKLKVAQSLADDQRNELRSMRRSRAK
jgi:hypothetical protein